MLLLKTSEVRKRLGVSRPTIYKYIERGELPFVRVGGLWKLDSRDLDAYLAKNRKV